jgi:hypothetical protein
VFRNSALIRILLVVFGLIPVGAWIAMAASLEPVGLGRSIGLALLIILAPLPGGGLLLILGAGTMAKAPRAGRIAATVGAAMVGLTVLFIAAVWARRFADCGGPPGICTPELLESLGLLAYALLQGGLAALVWRSRRNSADAEKFPPPRAAATK